MISLFLSLFRQSVITPISSVHRSRRTSAGS
nr:MAG TPA: hypothetical protein [Caudoviricetes sp.]